VDNTDREIVVMTREQFDWLLQMAKVGVSEFGRQHQMAEFLHAVGLTNPRLPQSPKPKSLIDWQKASMAEIDAWIEEQVEKNEAGFQREAFNALMIPLERTMTEFMSRPASGENARAANYEARQEVARWREKYAHCPELQRETFDCWIEFDKSKLNITYSEAMETLRAGNAALCLSRQVFTEVAMRNSGRV
jgi:hypothetical protein